MSLRLYNNILKEVKVKFTQPCLILCNPMTLCNPIDYTVHGILQARILEWRAFPFSRGSSWPRNGTGASGIAGGFFTSWATGEVLAVSGLRAWLAHPQPGSTASRLSPRSVFPFPGHWLPVCHASCSPPGMEDSQQLGRGNPDVAVGRQAGQERGHHRLRGTRSSFQQDGISPGPATN